MIDVDILEQQAIDAAVNQHWRDAISLNKKILTVDSKNLDATLRLGFANLQMNDIDNAKKYYQKALRIQPKNNVASENLERIKVLSEKGNKKILQKESNLDPNLFLEVPGKTKSIALVNIGQKKDLAELTVGQEVELKLKKRKVEARTKSGYYIGSLPDDLSKRLNFFFKAKSKYIAYIKEANLSKVVIFIQEILKGKKVAHYLSFPQSNQSPIDQSINDESEEQEEVGTSEDEWDPITHDLPNEEKEEIADIHPEEETEE